MLLGLEAALAHQCFQRFDEITWEWHDPLFAAFAAQAHVRSRAIEPKVACIDAERFGDAGAGSSEEQQQRPVPAATVCLLVRRVDEGVKFLPDEVVCDLGVRLLYRDGEDALRDAERRGVICGHVVEERPDRRQTRVACLDRVLPLLLKLVQEGENDVAVEMLDGQFTRLAPSLIGGEQISMRKASR